MYLKCFNPLYNTLFIVIITLFLGKNALGQVPQINNTHLFAKHEVSGIVKDSLGAPLANTLVILISPKDSVNAFTNDDGVFIFKEINSADFELKLSHIGYTAIRKKFFFNAINHKLILDPIILGIKSNELKEVIVNGAPSIVYKTDTVEYKASDYKVTKNARLDELLRQMQGVEVGSDGSMQYLGQQVKKARLNGKNFAGGDVAQVIQNLPADIADKVQFIDDYGTQANRTGIKTGDPVKAINITTKKEKSIGNVAQVAAGEGTNGRYNDRLFAQHLNGNQQIGLIGNVTNTINKVSGYGNDNTNDSRNGTSTGSLSSNNGSGGNSTLGNVAFTYRDQLANNFQINLNYLYTRKILDNSVQSEAQQLDTSLPLLTSSQSMLKNSSDDHSLNVEFEYTPDTKNYILFTPVFNYSKYDNLSGINIKQTGLINQMVKSNPDNRYSKPLGTANLYWQYLFNKSGRNFSIEAGYLQSTESFQSLQSDRISYLTPKGGLIRDSTVQRDIFKKSNNQTVSATLQYIEPLNKTANVQIQLQTTFKQFDNLFETSDAVNTASNFIDSLTRRFSYSFLQNQVSSSYQYMTKRVNLSVGLGLLATTLKGPQPNINTSESHNGLYLVPIFRFQYRWSAQQSASINYSSSVREPDFTQLQPVPDYSNAINTVFGNPNLKPALSHRISADYFNYLPNQRINIALNLNATIVRNQVVSDVSQIYLAEQGSYLNQTYFRNLNGNYTVNSNLTTSKQINHAIILEYNAAINYGHINALNNHDISSIENWHIIQRLGPKIVPNERVQIYPFFAYDIFKLNNSNQGISDYNDLKTTSLNLQGNFNIMQRWFTNINVSKNHTSGLNTANKNPFLLNLSIERELFANHNGRLKLQTFDLLNQNNYINRVITANSITDISSAALKRYFMLSLIMNFQKWGGAVSKKGKELKRRGDGSFIYP